MSGVEAPASGVCRNCGAGVPGRFCAECGQARDVHVPSTGELLHEALEGLTHSDSRLWRTLKLLILRPGELTLEFIRGRRAAYLPPFRLYLILSVLFFFCASLIKSHLVVVSFSEDGSPTQMDASRLNCADVDFPWLREHPAWRPRVDHACRAALADNGASWAHLVLSSIPKAMFVFLPLVAFLNMLFYWRPRHPYAEHLVFFLHLHALFFCIATLLLVNARLSAWLPAFKLPAGLLALLLYLSGPLYTALAIRRVFARSWVGTFCKAGALALVYVATLLLMVLAVMIYAGLQL
jgi:hypothetical protein